jgi:tol-pal system-associated acyl-CoA thioesterase
MGSRAARVGTRIRAMVDSPEDRRSGAANELRATVKVYLEDTDAQGIVYHANYLKYFERTRTDYLEEHGAGLKGAQDLGYRFVVHALSVQFHKPAVLGDRLEIVTTVHKRSPFRLVFEHRAFRAGEQEPRTSAKVDVACIDGDGELCEITQDLLRIDDEDS